MIASLTGDILSLSPGICVLSVAGVGYQCLIPFSTYRALKSSEGPVNLWVHTYVRQDTLSLYGFSTLREKELFNRLILLNGVGPKVALCILSGLSADEFISAVNNQDARVLSSIPGIGPKTAERILFELKGKIQDDQTGEKEAGIRMDALSALENLGYRRPQILKVLDRILKNHETLDLEEFLVLALKELSP